MTPRPVVVGVVAAAMATVVGCGDDVAAPAPDRELRAEAAWSRPTPPGAERGVAYLTLHSDRSDAVVGAEVLPELAGAASLHRTMSHDDASHHGGGAAGEMSMEAVDALPVTPTRPLVFEPGGDHVMLEDLVAPLTRGFGYRLTLVMRSGRRLVVDVVVGDEAPR